MKGYSGDKIGWENSTTKYRTDYRGMQARLVFTDKIHKKPWQ